MEEEGLEIFNIRAEIRDKKDIEAAPRGHCIMIKLRRLSFLVDRCMKGVFSSDVLT